jgi:hypothetical protein
MLHLLVTVPFSNYIIYVDESGDHSLDSIDANYPVFVLAFCIFEKAAYHTAVNALLDLKFATWGHDMVVIHEREIRMRSGDFVFMNAGPGVAADFLGKITQFVQDAPFRLIASVIDKRRLKAQYSYPDNPYEMALTFCLERAYMYLSGLGQVGNPTWVIVESRGKKEDAQLELAFRRICDGANLCGGSGTGAKLPFLIRFCDKRANSTGMQLADLVARPIGKSVHQPDSQKRIWPVIASKFRTGPGGKIWGWGLKVFP